jgi:hypothetical protein
MAIRHIGIRGEVTLERRKFIVGSAVSASVATRPYVAAGQDQPLVGNAQPQPLSFGQAGRDFPKLGGNLANQSRMLYQQGVPHSRAILHWE